MQSRLTLMWVLARVAAKCNLVPAVKVHIVLNVCRRFYRINMYIRKLESSCFESIEKVCGKS